VIPVIVIVDVVVGLDYRLFPRLRQHELLAGLGPCRLRQTATAAIVVFCEFVACWVL
jgi:hypothetical protein